MHVDLSSLPIWHVVEDFAVKVLARLTGWTGMLIGADQVQAISYKVFDADAANVVTGSGDLTPAESISDEPQTDSGWPHPEAGYNFAAILPAKCFPTGGHLYVVQITVTPKNGDPFPIPPYRVYAHEWLESTQ
jgi:hypothetical protein